MVQPSSGKNFSSLVDYTEGFFVTVVFRIIFGLALMHFLWNVYQLIKDGGDEGKRKDHQKAIMWSLIAIAAMMSVWALVAIVTGTFGEPTVLPQIDSKYLDSF
jgi:succinate dehydrogenase/fumarate reductase cytochrome b subunit